HEADMELVAWMTSTEKGEPSKKYLEAPKTSISQISQNQTTNSQVYDAIMRRDDELGKEIEQAKAVSAAQEIVSAAQQRQTVFLVDDEQGVRDIFSEYLIEIFQGLGQEVVCRVFRKNEEALEALKQGARPILALLDFEVSGSELKTRDLVFGMKKLSSQTKMVIMSGYEFTPEFISVNFGKGISYFLKPASIEEIRKLVMGLGIFGGQNGETELDRTNKAEWLDRWNKGVFLITPEQAARSKIQRKVGPFTARLTPHEKKLRKPAWQDMPVNLDLPFDPSKFNFSKIKPEEILVDGLKLGNKNWRSVINGSPTEQFASMLVPEVACNQFLHEEDIVAFIEYMNLTSACVFYNSLWAGASVNSKHFQLYYSWPYLFDFIGQQNLEWADFGQVAVADLTGYGSNISLIKGVNGKQKILALWIAVDYLQKRNIPFEFGALGDIIAVMPVGKEGPALFEGAPWGAPERMGLFNVMDKALFERLTYEDLVGALKDATLALPGYTVFLREYHGMLYFGLKGEAAYVSDGQGPSLVNRFRDSGIISTILSKGGLDKQVFFELVKHLEKGFKVHVASEAGQLSLREVLTRWGGTGITKSLDKLAEEKGLLADIDEARRDLLQRRATPFSRWLEQAVQSNPGNVELRALKLCVDYLKGGARRIILEKSADIADLAVLYDPEGRGRNILRVILKKEYEKVVSAQATDQQVWDILKSCSFQDITKGIVGETNIYKAHKSSLRETFSNLIRKDERLLSLARENGFDIDNQADREKVIGLICNGVHVASNSELPEELALLSPVGRKALVDILNRAPSARPRPGKATPTQAEVEATLKQIREQSLPIYDLSSEVIFRAASELRRINEGSTAMLLERLYANNQIHAPPVVGVFNGVFGLVYFEDGIIDQAHLRIYIPQDIRDITHPENLATIIHELIEANQRLLGDTIVIAHQKAERIDSQFRMHKNYTETERGGIQLILLSGPSAVGKGPLWEQLKRRFPDYFERIILYTSR
ncbi:MAG: hypothetical protein KJ818_07300, partial [Candidatus Omnitrophica bacterium]|nr:hypothetical protein [Candidatus Omnitrophota bacterium]